MDTVEELNGTYFYAGHSNLSAAQLLFMIFLEKTLGHFGLDATHATGVGAILSGRNNLGTRAKSIGATKGTSYASKASRALFKKTRVPFGMELPTWLGGYTPWTAKRVMVRNLAPFVGRTIPLLGMIILAGDISYIAYCSVRDYNMIARGDDKIW